MSSFVHGRWGAGILVLALIGCGNKGESGAGEPAASGAPAATGAPAKASAAASASAAAFSGPAWAALFAGAPKVPLGGSFTGSEYKLMQPTGWGHRDSGQDCYWIDESADKSATLLTKCNLKRPVDSKAVELWTKTLLPKDFQHDGNPVVIEVGPAGSPVRAGHATCKLKEDDADVVWFEVSTNNGRSLLITVLKKSASEQVRNETAGWIQSLELIGKPEFTKQAGFQK
jgi:hypothetical protein